jgi:Farnesoic acid 0-methyl transferase
MWVFDRVSIVIIILVRELTVHSPPTYGHDLAWFVTTSNFFLFRVRACSDVRLLLAAEPYSKNDNNGQHVHEVVIGGWHNSRSVIYRDLVSNTTAVEASTPNILSCDELRQFWIRWQSDGKIAVGQNVINTAEFLSYVDPAPHKINGISVSTGAGSSGEWQFVADSGT